MCRLFGRVFSTQLAAGQSATRATRSLGGEGILQADGETVEKVTINESSILPTVDTTVKAPPEGTLSRREDKCRITRTIVRRIHEDRHRQNKAAT